MKQNKREKEKAKKSTLKHKVKHHKRSEQRIMLTRNVETVLA